MQKGILLSSVIALSAMAPPTFASSLQKATSSYVISDYAKTKYPLLMVHGLIGFTRLGTKTFGIDYWYQILPDLAKNGANAYAAQVSPVNSTEIRGEQLLQQIDEVIALTGQPKVNLIGHSHGGPTIQYIEAIAPTKVASLTSIAGPAKGTPLADIILDSSILNPVGQIVFSLIGESVKLLEGNTTLPTDYNASLNSFSVKGMAAFNKKFPSNAVPATCDQNGQKITDNGVYHYSWTGNRQLTNIFDVLDTSVSGLGVFLLKSTDNDGLIPVCSASYGQVIRNNYSWNHFDEINQVLGLRGLFSQDPVQVFREHANRLKNEGL